MDYTRLLRIPQYFRNLHRLTEIVRVLAAHGFGDLIHRLQLGRYVPRGFSVFSSPIPADALNQSAELKVPLELAGRLKLACEELGPTFIKLGQLVATRPDLFPPSITEELKDLQDRVTSFPFSQALQVLEEEFDRPIDTIFASIDEQPLAAASIAQVHRARLVNGQDVVIKVQRPGIMRVIDTDLDILRGLATLVEEHIPESRSAKPVDLIEEFARGMKAECDFRREARNLELFSQCFPLDEDLIVPAVSKELCTRRVLVEEFIDGVRADDVATLASQGVNLRLVAQRINRVVLESIFIHRYFHADPHPGNILVTATGRVGFIDFGAMGRLDDSRLRQVLELLVAVFSRDAARMLRVLEEHQIAPPDIDEGSLRNQLSELLDAYVGQSLGTLNLAQLVRDIYEILHRYQLRVPSDLLLVGKSLTTLEHLGVTLDPTFQPLDSIYPFLSKRYIALVSDPRTYGKIAFELGDAYRRLITELPGELRLLLRRAARTSIVVENSSKDLEELKRHQNSMLNRAIMTSIGITLLAIGMFLRPDDVHRTNLSLAAHYLLLGAGAFLLFGIWLAVKRTGGVS